VGDFSGEVRLLPDGNIYGRLAGKTKGECIKGALQDGWELLDGYRLPTLDPDYLEKMKAKGRRFPDRYQLSYLRFAVFAPLRDLRHIDQALMDLLLEPENVCALLDRITDVSVSAIPLIAAAGADGAIIYDDLGMQHAPFFSPAVFRELLKPYYKKLADALHAHGMDFFVHSCGNVTAFIPDWIDAGVDAFQFDQPELHGSLTLAERFGDRATFFCPVDIQTIMPTGSREVIEAGARHMVEVFKAHGASLIVKDYDNWDDINVLPEWRQWARDAVISCADN
jgi:uroporphyrinogen decarboxylase